MTLRLTEEQREIRELAREFSRKELRPHAPAWDAARGLDPAVFAKLGELGFMGMRVPEAYGGLELDLASYLLVLEELAWGDASVALGVAIHSGPVTSLVLAHGTEGQKEEWLPRLATGEVLGAFALSEAGAGSDARALSASYRPEGPGWVLDGRKKWITNGGRAGLIVLFAKEEGGEGISAFLVDRRTPGYRPGKREVTMGMAASETVEVELDGLRLEEGALLGEEKAGFRYAMEAMDVGRLGISAQALGIARAAFEHARAYASERVQFDTPLSGFQATRFKLAEMSLRITRGRALMRHAAESLEAARPGVGSKPLPAAGEVDPEAPAAGALAAMAKATASEDAVWITDEAVQIFGGYGYMRDYPVEKLLRDAKGTEIYEGTNEIMRLVVARDALRAAGA